MRPTSFFWLFSSVLLLVNAVPVPVRLVRSGPFTILKRGRSFQLNSPGLANVGESDGFEVNLEKREKTTKAKAAPTPVKAQPTNATINPIKPTVNPTKPTVNPTKGTVNPTVKPTTQATVKPTEATARPTTIPTNLTKTSSTPAATGTGKSCPIRKGPRGFSLEKRAAFDKNSAPGELR